MEDVVTRALHLRLRFRFASLILILRKESKIVAASVTMSLCLRCSDVPEFTFPWAVDWTRRPLDVGSTFPRPHAHGHFVWGFIKGRVFTQRIPTLQELRNRIRQAAAAITLNTENASACVSRHC